MTQKQDSSREPSSHYPKFAIRPYLTITLLIILSVFTSNYQHSFVVANKNSQQQPTYLQRPDSNGRPLLMVAFYCPNNQQDELTTTNQQQQQQQQQYYTQYLEIETGKWRSNRDSSSISSCSTQDNKQDILNLCKRAYPNHDIRNIVESSRSYKIENWCKVNSQSKRRCHSRFTVKPYRCLEGTFQSDALLVPDRCLFDHLHNKTICESSTNWNRIASDNCYYKSMRLESFSMLQPCGLGVFSGVEFVCCPHTTSTTSTSTQQSLIDENSFTDQLSEKEMQSGKLSPSSITPSSSAPTSTTTTTNGSRDVDGDDDTWDSNDDDDEDEYDDDSSSANPTASSSSSSSTTTTSTTTTTTTTTPPPTTSTISTTTSATASAGTTQRPIDHYLAHFDVTHERDEFRRAEMAVEATYRDKITAVIKNWSQVDSHYEEMKKRDPQAAELFKKSMTANLEKTIQALEQEAENQRHQLTAMHAERAMALINRRKKSAMDCLTQALDKDPIRIRQVEKCIVRLLKALEKDREHTFRQYKNLLILNTREALHEKKIILDHLVTLNRAANQSIAMLHRSSVLVDELKGKVVSLWHKMRKIPLEQTIDRELEARMMERIEEEVAQRKIKQERERLAYNNKQQQSTNNIGSSSSSSMLVQDVVQKSKQSIAENRQQQHQDDLNDNNQQYLKASNQQNLSNSDAITNNNTNTKFEQIIPDQVMQIDQSQQQQQFNSQSEQFNNTSSSPTFLVTNDSMSGSDNEAENEIRDHALEAPKFSHLKADPSHLELTFSIKHEPTTTIINQAGSRTSRWAFAHPIYMISMCTLVLAILIMGVKYYNRNSERAYKRQGFAEVGRSCPEEKTVTNLQFNGYENPAYKFFEAEA